MNCAKCKKVISHRMGIDLCSKCLNIKKSIFIKEPFGLPFELTRKDEFRKVN